MNLRRAISAIAFVISFPVLAQTTMELIPRGRPFKLTFADPREVRMAINFEGDSKINAAVGNYFSLFALRPEPGEAGMLFHFGLEGAGYFTMRSADGRFPLETTDGLIGLYFEGSRDAWQWQVRYTHISAHLADGSHDSPISYSRETLIGRLGWSPSPEIQAYGGIHYLMNSTPRLEPWGLQLGGAFFVPGKQLSPFIAADFKWRNESDVRTSLSLQAGIALNNPPEAYRSFRFFYAYFTGANPRGQYFSHSYTSHSVGVEMQI